MLTSIKIHVLPGGVLPARQTDEAIGYDVSLRAIVCAHETDIHQPHLRKTLFDFTSIPADPEIARHVVERDGELLYRMEPGESILGGIGFITAMPFPIFYWVTPRSGLASKHGIQVTNAPGTVDPDYRGEAGVLVLNRNPHTYELRRKMRIAQIIFMPALIPELMEVDAPEELEPTARGAGGFGSTGI